MHGTLGDNPPHRQRVQPSPQPPTKLLSSSRPGVATAIVAKAARSQPTVPKPPAAPPPVAVAVAAQPFEKKPTRIVGTLSTAVMANVAKTTTASPTLVKPTSATHTLASPGTEITTHTTRGAHVTHVVDPRAQRKVPDQGKYCFRTAWLFTHFACPVPIIF